MLVVVVVVEPDVWSFGILLWVRPDIIVLADWV